MVDLKGPAEPPLRTKKEPEIVDDGPGDTLRRAHGIREPDLRAASGKSPGNGDSPLDALLRPPEDPEPPLPETGPHPRDSGDPAALPPETDDPGDDDLLRRPGVRDISAGGLSYALPPEADDPGDDAPPRPSGVRDISAGGLSYPFPAEPRPHPRDSGDPAALPPEEEGPGLPDRPEKPVRLASMEDILSRRPETGSAPSRLARIPGLAKLLSRFPEPGDLFAALQSRLAPLAARYPALEKVLALFAPEKEPELTSPDFFVGDTGEPSLTGSLKDVRITYPVDPPYQYVHIEYDREARALSYRVVEPSLSEGEEHYLGLIKKAFEKMIGTDIGLLSAERREEYLKERFLSIITILGFKFTDEQRDRIYFHLKKEYIGYSKIDTMMKDRYIEDISCNGANLDLYVQHRTYGPIQTNVRFGDLELNNFVLKLAQISGRHISLLQPIRDITLPDGSRGNLTLGGEVTRKGSTFTIRKFRSNPISPIEMMDYGTVDARQLAYLWILMEYKRSLLISGGTASGKTTFLNALCGFIPTEYKIVSIEDTTELNLMHPNWLQSVTRAGFGTGDTGGAPSGVGGGGRKAPGDISLYDLLIAALRQRPEFIIVGEVRGEEAFTLFQAIAVGHAAMGTIHAGSMDELLARVESSPMNLPRSLLANLDAVIFPMQIRKGERNVRRITAIVEILEIDREKGDLVTNTVFRWQPASDEFRFMGRSYLFDKIRDLFGISLEALRQEMDDRTALLLWMQEQHIREYKTVLGFIRAYYKDKDEIMAQVRSGAEITDDDIAALVAHAAPENGNGQEA